jgi:hypothetical protein
MKTRPIDRVRQRKHTKQERDLKVNWAGSLLKNISLIMSVVATAGYLLGYWFFDGYLGGYGYSMRAMPHDYAAVMMELFMLLIHAGGALVLQEWRALFAALLVGCVLTLYAALLLWLSSSAGAGKTRPGASIGERGRAWLVVVFAGFSPLATYVFVVLVFAALILPIAAASAFGKSVAQEEKANFLQCGNRSGKSACVAFDEEGKPSVVGDVVAGTDALVLIYDGATAHLLKRGDNLRGSARVR